MRRSLTRATAACAASALALSLWAAAPVAADEEEASSGADGVDSTAESGERGAPATAERTREQGGATSADGGFRSLAEPGGTSAADGSSATARSGRGRTEAESSHWTYVDRAFPDQSYDGSEAASVGTGRLEWDRVYTRRALFRFPVTLGSGTVVDSAALRTEVEWSYDCHSDSHVQLHRIDLFGSRTTWNNQPATRTLLDTRNVKGGRGACPVSGGVEFDVTAAYQWALDNGESHLHLRLKERDESGTTAWRRFGIENAPPVLVVDHGTPPSGGTLSGLADSPDGSWDGAAAAGPSEGQPSDRRTVTHDGDALVGNGPGTAPTGPAEGPASSGETVLGVAGADGVRVQNPVPADWTPGGGEQARSTKRGTADRPTVPGSRQQQDRSTVLGPRGPPAAATAGDRTPVRRPQGTG